jgi:hypothetical protein
VSPEPVVDWITTAGARCGIPRSPTLGPIQSATSSRRKPTPPCPPLWLTYDAGEATGVSNHTQAQMTCATAALTTGLDRDHFGTRSPKCTRLLRILDAAAARRCNWRYLRQYLVPVVCPCLKTVVVLETSLCLTSLNIVMQVFFGCNRRNGPAVVVHVLYNHPAGTCASFGS